MLGNFSYENPTKIYFGKKSILHLPEELQKYGKKVLLVYGGGSIKRIGLYDQILDIMQQCGKEVVEISGVMPNPTLDKLAEGIKTARETRADFILAVGGGSVLDYAKAVSISVFCEEDPWEKYFIRFEDVSCPVIPVGTVLTMAGTGSEADGGMVITNTEKNLKNGHNFTNPAVYPRFSILDPEYTYSLPKYQMVSGIYDIMSHIIETYFCGTDDNTSDYISEGLLRGLINSARIAVVNPEDYEARSNIMWTATWAMTGLISKGKTGDWMVHKIGQAIAAYTDAAHDMTLSAVASAYYRHIMMSGLPKFKRFAVNVWNINPEGKDDVQIAAEGLEAMENFLKEIGAVTRASEVGVTEELIQPITGAVRILEGGYKLLSQEEIEQILRESM